MLPLGNDALRQTPDRFVVAVFQLGLRQRAIAPPFKLPKLSACARGLATSANDDFEVVGTVERDGQVRGSRVRERS